LVKLDVQRHGRPVWLTRAVKFDSYNSLTCSYHPFIGLSARSQEFGSGGAPHFTSGTNSRPFNEHTDIVHSTKMLKLVYFRHEY